MNSRHIPIGSMDLSSSSTAEHDADEFDALRAIVAGTAQARGDEFFELLVRNLSLATGVPNAFIARFASSNQRVRTIAFWQTDHHCEPQEWDLDGTPCERVVSSDLCHFPDGVSKQFPKEIGVESYLGVPLRDVGGHVLGHLAIYDKRPMPSQPRLLSIFRIFAARAVAELERLRDQQILQASEERFRDLFDEAPIAYVHEGLDSRFINANRSALRILGVRPDEVAYTYGRSLVPDTPDAQRRLKEAFDSIGQGTDTSGVILELKRKDNGKPVWIQWWSKPDPSGLFTRTMFIDVTDHVLMAEAKDRLHSQNLYLQEEIKSVHNFDEIIGHSQGLRSVLEQVTRVAPTDASVLIRGETGTGKELIARAIHSASRRRDKPLIKINCAALPEGLVESELFGHEKGAFTGAIAKRLGRFELADGGTLFLDEIGEVPLDVQAKLLRVLQEREFERLGGSGTIRVDVRIIAATNRDLLSAVAAKTFREDLFYRLNVFPVMLPPLRERIGDIPLLVKFLTARFSARIGKAVDGVSTVAMNRLQSYRWPGNIRELENVIERAIILSDSRIVEVSPEMLPESLDSPVTMTSTEPFSASAVPAGDAAFVPTENLESKPVTASQDAVPSGTGSLEEVGKLHILSVLRQTRWVIEGQHGAAKILNLHPNTLRSRMKKLGISRESHEHS